MISVVIPVYNEMDSLLPLYGEIAAAALHHALDLEVVFVDDGSSDGSWKVIKELARQHPKVRGVRFRRNFGKAAALSAGFRAAHGELILTLDADLQDDPAEIPRFLAAMEKGTRSEPVGPLPPTPLPAGERGGGEGADEGRPGVFDVVSGWKRVRHDPWHKVGPSRVFNFLVSRLTGVRLHDHNCGMKCYRAAVVREVRLYGELHRFIPVLAAARGQPLPPDAAGPDEVSLDVVSGWKRQRHDPWHKVGPSRVFIPSAVKGCSPASIQASAFQS